VPLLALLVGAPTTSRPDVVALALMSNEELDALDPPIRRPV
jgi:hypothetical protein